MMTVRHIRGLLALAAIAACLPVQADEPVPMQRLTPSEIAALAPPPNSGTPPAVQMTVLIGDPTKPGLYTVRVNIAPHTQVRPHTHRDNAPPDWPAYRSGSLEFMVFAEHPEVRTLSVVR
jgi:hypothetical protein